MKSTDTSERELENLIVWHLTANGYGLGAPADYQAGVALDTVQSTFCWKLRSSKACNYFIFKEKPGQARLIKYLAY